MVKTRSNVVTIPGTLSLIRAPYSAVIRVTGHLYLPSASFPFPIEAVTFKADRAKRKIWMIPHEKYNPADKNQQKAIKAGNAGCRVTLMPVLRFLGLECPTYSRPYEKRKVITLTRKGNTFHIRYSAIRSIRLVRRKPKYGFPPVPRHSKAANSENPVFKNSSSSF